MTNEIMRETDKIDFWKITAKYLGNKFAPGKISGVENSIIKMDFLNYYKIFSLLVDSKKYHRNRYLFDILLSRNKTNTDIVGYNECADVVLSQGKDGFDFEGVLGAASSIALNFRRDILGGIANDAFPGCNYRFYFMRSHSSNDTIYAGVPFFIVYASVWFENNMNFIPHILVHPSLHRMTCYITRCLTKSDAISLCRSSTTKIEYFYQKGKMLETLHAIVRRASDNFYHCNRKKIGRKSTPVRTDLMSSISFANLTKNIVTEVEHDGSFDAFRIVIVNLKFRVEWVTSPYSLRDNILKDSSIFGLPSKPSYPIRKFMLSRLGASVERKMDNIHVLNLRKMKLFSSGVLKTNTENYLHRGDLFWKLNDVINSENRLFTENFSQEINAMALDSIDFSQFMKKYSDPDLFSPVFSAGFSDSFSFRMNLTTMTVGIWPDLLVSNLALQKFERENGFRLFKPSTNYEFIKEFPIHFSVSRNSSVDDALKSLKVSRRIHSFHMIKCWIKNIVRVRQDKFKWVDIVAFIQRASEMFIEQLRKSPDFRKFVKEATLSYQAAFDNKEFRQAVMECNLERYALLNEVKSCSKKSIIRSCPELSMGGDISMEKFVSILQYFTGSKIDLIPQKL